MADETRTQLTDKLLHGVAHICVGMAVQTYSREMFPGGLRHVRHELHARGRRFEKAREILMSGKTTLSELELTSSDLSWVADQIDSAKDPDGLKSIFQAEADEIKKYEEAKAAEVGKS